jgi:fatty-acyl-CoA synthase
VAECRCTSLVGVPTTFIAELSHPSFADYDLSSLRTGIMAGSPCPVEVMKQVIEREFCAGRLAHYGIPRHVHLVDEFR